MTMLLEEHDLTLMRHLTRATESGRLLWLPVPDMRMCHLGPTQFGGTTYLVLEGEDERRASLSIRVKFPDGLTTIVFERTMNGSTDKKAMLVYDRLMASIDAAEADLREAGSIMASNKLTEASDSAEPNEGRNEDYPNQMNDWLWKEKDPR